MKHKLLSLPLAIVLILCSLAVPVFAAETTTDAAEAAKGKVCRIGGEGTGTYYATVKEALTAAAAEGDTITLISDAEWALDQDDKGNDKSWGNLETDKSVTFTGAVDAGGKPVHTLKFKNGGWITLKTAVLTVKNLNIVVEGKDGAVQAFAQIRGESVQNYENCVFTASGKRGSDSAEGNFFAINNVATGKIVTLHMKDCTINATHTGTVKKAWLINRTNDSHPVDLTFENVTANLGENIRGFGLGNKCVARLTGNTVVTLSEKAFCGSNFTAYVADGAKVVTSAEVIDPDAKNATFIVSSSEQFGAYTAPAQKAGATLRINGDSYGLRFTSEYTPATGLTEGTTVGFGTVIAKRSTLETLTGCDHWYGAVNMIGHDAFLNIACKNGKTTDESGKVTFHAAMVHIKEANVNEAFVARAYAKYSAPHDVTVFVYSSLDTEQNTAVYSDVIQKTLSNVKDASETGFATKVESYPVAGQNGYTWTAGEKFTFCTATQYEELKAIVD